jgi:hypothetical protein
MYLPRCALSFILSDSSSLLCLSLVCFFCRRYSSQAPSFSAGVTCLIVATAMLVRTLLIKADLDKFRAAHVPDVETARTVFRYGCRGRCWGGGCKIFHSFSMFFQSFFTAFGVVGMIGLLEFCV